MFIKKNRLEELKKAGYTLLIYDYDELYYFESMDKHSGNMSREEKTKK